jgi:hypothetical protein
VLTRAGGFSRHRRTAALHNSSLRLHVACCAAPSTIARVHRDDVAHAMHSSTIMRILSCFAVLVLVGCATADTKSSKTSLVDCMQTPSDPSCQGPACQAAPHSFACFCEQNPNDSHCTMPNCTQNPNAPGCQNSGDPCQTDPQGYECYCTQNPMDPNCQGSGDPCQVDPMSYECYCATQGQQDPQCQCDPNDPMCQGGDPCQIDPQGFECYCATQGQQDPQCQCDPNDPMCQGGDPCQTDPQGFACYCATQGQQDPQCQCDPNDPMCQGGGDACQIDPNGDECYCQQVPDDPYCW